MTTKATSHAVVLSVFAHAALLSAPLALGHASAKSWACFGLLLTLSLCEIVVSPLDATRKNIAATVSAIALLAIGGLSILRGQGSWMGAPIAFCGILLRGMAIRELGEGFSSAIEPRAPSLVTTGVYGVSRHPSEIGLVLISIGLGVLGGSGLAGYVIAIAMIPSIAVRVISEERALSARFGAVHALYRERVRIVLPGR